VWAIPSSTVPLPGPLPFHSLSPNSNALFEPQSRPPSNLSSTVHPHSPHAQPPVLHCLPSTLAEVGSLPAPSTPANVTCPVQPQAPLPVNRFILSNTHPNTKTPSSLNNYNTPFPQQRCTAPPVVTRRGPNICHDGLVVGQRGQTGAAE
jgi:hypothetical protein